MSAEGTKMPEPMAPLVAWAKQAHLHARKMGGVKHMRADGSAWGGFAACREGDVGAFAVMAVEDVEALLLASREGAIAEAIAACDDVEEPAWFGHECPYTFNDGKAECMQAIRALADVDAKEKGNG